MIEVYRRVIAAVQPQQATPAQAQCIQSFDTSPNKLRRAALAMLASGPQLTVQHVPFGAQIGKDRRIAVVLLVGVRNALFGRTGVVKRTDVDIHWHQFQVAGFDRAELTFAKQARVQVAQSRMTAHRRQLVQTLTQDRLRRQTLNPVSIGENTITPI